jgi:hypothetical protein
MVENELLCDRATLRVAEYSGRIDTEMIEQAHQVGRELRDGIWRRQAAAPTVSAQSGTMTRYRAAKRSTTSSNMSPVIITP